MSDKNTAFDFWDGASLSANGTLSKTLHGLGAKQLRVQVRSDNGFSVDVEWKDGQGNTIRDETNALGGSLTGGSWSTGDLTVHSPHLTVEVNEDSGSDSTLDGHVYLV